MDSIEEQFKTVTLPSDPKALARAIVDRYEVRDLIDIANVIDEALPTMADVLEEIVRNAPRSPLPDPDTFSEQQLQIVKHLYREKQFQFDMLDKGFFRSLADTPGHIYWRPEDLGGEMTPSRRASISRALRRLEERGIVHRLPGPGGRRSVQVMLSNDGERLAERLLNE